MEAVSWADYASLADGFHRRQQRDWERTRWMTWHLVNIHLAPKDKLESPEELLALNGDVPKQTLPAAPPETPEQMIARLRLLDPDKFSS